MLMDLIHTYKEKYENYKQAVGQAEIDKNYKELSKQANKLLDFIAKNDVDFELPIEWYKLALSDYISCLDTSVYDNLTNEQLTEIATKCWEDDSHEKTTMFENLFDYYLGLFVSRVELPKGEVFDWDLFLEKDDEPCDLDTLAERVGNYLSGKYGFCLNGFQIKLARNKIYVSDIDWDLEG